MQLSIASYNVLAQSLIHRELFPFASKGSLKLKRRIHKIIETIKNINADIVCLQEVDHFEDLYRSEFESAGYDLVYDKIPKKTHGLCLLWKREKFKRLDAQCLSFDDHPLTHPTEIFPVTDNIGQILTLQFKNSSMTKKLVITNCLLFWRPTAHFVRLRQAWVLYKEALKVNQDILIMAGDYNSCPDLPTYRALCCHDMTEKSMDQLQRSFSPRNLESPVEEVLPTDPEPALNENVLTIDQLLKDIFSLPKVYSAYRSYSSFHPPIKHPDWEEGGERWTHEPPYTTYGQWKGLLDYIFVIDPQLELQKLNPIPSPAQLDPGIPNDVYGSDHV